MPEITPEQAIEILYQNRRGAVAEIVERCGEPSLDVKAAIVFTRCLMTGGAAPAERGLVRPAGRYIDERRAQIDSAMTEIDIALALAPDEAFS